MNLSYGETVRVHVKTAQLELLEQKGCIKHNCSERVSLSSSRNAYNDSYMNSYMNCRNMSM